MAATDNGDLLLGVVEVHGPLGLVVSGHLEGHDLQADEPRGHGEDLSTVGGVVQVTARLRMGHASRVAAHDVEVGAGYHAGPAVPLDLQGTGGTEQIAVNPSNLYIL